MHITFKQLEIFIGIAKNTSVSQAAIALNLSQSACSVALATLENQLGGSLFDRRGKKLLLNERGRTLLPKAHHLVSQGIEIQALMTSKNITTLTGHLLIGASSTIGNYLLPYQIADFIHQHANTKITLTVANTEQIVNQLKNFEIDLGFIEGRCLSSEIKVIPWKMDQLIVIASPHHPLSQKKRISITDLQAARWILREKGSGTRDRLEEVMGDKIQPFLELGHTEAIKRSVEANLGISCLSRLAVVDSLEAGKLVELKTSFLTLDRKFYLLLHKEKYQTLLLDEFIKNVFG